MHTQSGLRASFGSVARECRSFPYFSLEVRARAKLAVPVCERERGEGNDEPCARGVLAKSPLAGLRFEREQESMQSVVPLAVHTVRPQIGSRVRHAT